MLKLQQKGSRFSYSIWTNPVARVLKLQGVQSYLEMIRDTTEATRTAGESVLDYGSGDRPYEPMLRNQFAKYLSADYEPAKLKHTGRPDIYLDNEKTGLETASIDCVIITEVLEHVYEPKKTLRELHRITRPDGFVVGSVPFAVGEHESPYDFHRYTSFCLTRMLEESGFEVVKLDYVGDMVGVALSVASRVAAVVPKTLEKVGLKFVGRPIHLLFRIPELMYFALHRIGVRPARIKYFQNFPLGFTFLARRIPDNEASTAETPELLVDPPSHAKD